MSKTYAEMLAEAEARTAAILAREATPEELARLRSPEELNVDTEANRTYCVGALVWDKTYNYKGANGAFLSRTITRNLYARDAVAHLRQCMTNENLKDIHIYPEVF